MDNNTLLSVFLVIAIISVILVDIFIIYMFVSAFCCVAAEQRNETIRELSRPFIQTSTATATETSINAMDGYYTSL